LKISPCTFSALEMHYTFVQARIGLQRLEVTLLV
jgi:hypothetical protein